MIVLSKASLDTSCHVACGYMLQLFRSGAAALHLSGVARGAGDSFASQKASGGEAATLAGPDSATAANQAGAFHLRA